MSSLLFDDLAFDPTAKQIAEQRLAAILEHLQHWSQDNPNWQRFTTDQSSRQALLEELRVSVRKASLVWYERLHALACDLGWEKRIISALAAGCLGRGWFDIPSRSDQHHRPALRDVLPGLTSTLSAHNTVETRAQAFVTAKLCRDIGTGRAVSQSFLHLRVLERTAAMIYSVLERWHHYGALGLLMHSDYLCYEELLGVQQFLQRNMEPLAAGIRTTIFSDVVALKSGICQTHPPLWHANLLTEPHHTAARRKYKKRLFPRIRDLFAQNIAEARGCSPAESMQLLELYCDQGITGILAWRSSQTHKIQLQFRINCMLEEVCCGLSTEVKAEIATHIEHVFAAAETLRFSLSLHSLLLDAPSSPQRLATKRRLYATRKKNHREGVTEKQLAAAYAERAGLDLAGARFRLRAFLTYGVLGLLPVSLWGALIHPQLFEWLRFIKLGYPAGAVRWSDIYGQACSYSAEYQLPRYSSQLLHALYNSMGKYPHWHGGKGLVMLRIHQRFPKAVTSRPRLNAEWLICSCRLPVAIAADAHSSHLTLVADSETQLPVGLWISSLRPASQEVGLALYQAIWHVGDIDFPIRGLPQAITIPGALVADNMLDLQRAAAYLLTDIKVDDTPSMRGKRRILECLRSIQLWSSDIGGKSDRPFLQPASLMRELLAMVRQHYFPFHRQEVVPFSIRRTGHALPGNSLPTAGWLLPAQGQVIVHSGIINIQGDRFAAPETVPSKISLTYRRLPLLFPSGNEITMLPPIFIEVPGSSSPQLVVCPAIH